MVRCIDVRNRPVFILISSRPIQQRPARLPPSPSARLADVLVESWRAPVPPRQPATTVETVKAVCRRWGEYILRVPRIHDAGRRTRPLGALDVTSLFFLGCHRAGDSRGRPGREADSKWRAAVPSRKGSGAKQRDGARQSAPSRSWGKDSAGRKSGEVFPRSISAAISEAAVSRRHSSLHSRATTIALQRARVRSHGKNSPHSDAGTPRSHRGHSSAWNDATEWEGKMLVD
jgi:hypothetical protein